MQRKYYLDVICLVTGFLALWGLIITMLILRSMFLGSPSSNMLLLSSLLMLAMPVVCYMSGVVAIIERKKGGGRYKISLIVIGFVLALLPLLNLFVAIFRGWELI